MKVNASGLQDWLIILIRSGNLEVDSSPFREKICTDPSTSLWICARWPSYLQLCKLWPIAYLSNFQTKHTWHRANWEYILDIHNKGEGDSKVISNKVDRNTTRPKASFFVASYLDTDIETKQSHLNYNKEKWMWERERETNKAHTDDRKTYLYSHVKALFSNSFSVCWTPFVILSRDINNKNSKLPHQCPFYFKPFFTKHQ